MKKLIPLIALSTAGFILTGCSNASASATKDFKDRILNFKNQVENYAVINTSASQQKVLDKYVMTLEETEDNEVAESSESSENDAIIEYIDNDDTKDSENKKPQDEDLPEEENDETISESEMTDGNDTPDFSTLYSINNDISESCDDFCELKEEITEAILETQSLIEKVQNKEIELTREQRMFLTNQAMEIKNLSNQLSVATDELSLSLSELNALLQKGENNDNLSLKSLILLNNLMRGNDLLFNGLSSLNMMNAIMRMENVDLPYNSARILYGYQQNDQEPVIKDYTIDKNGNVTENNSSTDTETTNETLSASTDNDKAKNTNIDTYTKRKLKSNIDTYGNFNKRNIDTFFNTALLDNEFMYGNGGFNGMYPYMEQNTYNNATHNKQNTNTISSNNENINTPESEYGHITKDIQEQDRVQKKSLFTKNIDTYKNAESSSLNSSFKALKNSVSSFFSRFKTNKDIEFPIDNKTLENK